MSTGLIVAIAIVVVLVVVLLAVMPRLRRAKAERQLNARREEHAGRHRDEAETRRARAELAEREARTAKAEAELHETRAELHERGLADEEIRNGDMPPAREEGASNVPHGSGDAGERDAEGRPARHCRRPGSTAPARPAVYRAGRRSPFFVKGPAEGQPAWRPNSSPRRVAISVTARPV
jgi:hypothetical protein